MYSPPFTSFPEHPNVQASGALTPDKPLLSGPTTGPEETPTETFAINCTALGNPHAAENIDSFVRDSLSENTRRAYASDLAQFLAWGGSVPATKEVIAAYLSEHAASHSPTSLTRWLASLSKAHRALSAEDPTKGELVRSVLRGIRRRYGRPPAQALPLTREILLDVLDAIPEDLRGVRDRALLLVGFAGGFRRSEVVELEAADVAKQEEGLVITLRRSKTDQTGQGRKIGIPFARGRHCAVKALGAWLELGPAWDGPIFRPIDRHGVTSMSRLSGQAVSLIIRERLHKAGFEPTGFSGHSLRAGFVTSAARAGVSSWKIREQTGHSSDAMLARYIRDNDIFTDNAAGALL
jgi:integrase